MISELLGHVAAVVSMRNVVPCGISDAKESRMIFGNAGVLRAGQVVLIKPLSRPAGPASQPANQPRLHYLCHSIFNETTLMSLFVHASWQRIASIRQSELWVNMSKRVRTSTLPDV